jgi:hypothetical protein
MPWPSRGYGDVVVLLGLVMSCPGTTVDMEMQRVMVKEAHASTRKAGAVVDATANDDDGGAEDTINLPTLVGMDVEKDL